MCMLKNISTLLSAVAFRCIPKFVVFFSIVSVGEITSLIKCSYFEHNKYKARDVFIDWV